MTIQPKYTLTEAHFVIADLKKEIDRLKAELRDVEESFECGCASGYRCGDHYTEGWDE